MTNRIDIWRVSPRGWEYSAMLKMIAISDWHDCLFRGSVSRHLVSRRWFQSVQYGIAEFQSWTVSIRKLDHSIS
jgi:hypothetical protein